MRVIECRQLGKNFRTYLKAPGLAGTLRSFVKRDFRDNPAVSNFDLDLEPGELVGLLGPNGAGKTTLIKMLTGIIVPTTGRVSVLGYEPFRRPQAFRKRIALVMGQKSQLWWDIPAMDSFLLLQRYYEIDDAKFRGRIDLLSDILGVRGVLHVHVRKLSLGERMKMELMASLLHEPEVIFLDEPTIGLDIVAQKSIRDFLARYQREHGTTIILTSHYMADVQALCSRIVLILQGKKRFDGSRSGFEGILGREKFVTVRFSERVDDADPIWKGLFPVWGDDRMQVELRIAEADLRRVGVEILSRFPVVDLATENLPIERVMSTLMARPELLPEL
ncbi:MAG: ATP-binding cassette domain-containing protein [Acidobacteriota bacterium]